MIGIIETEVDDKVLGFVNTTNVNIEEGSLTRSPFIGSLKLYEKDTKYILIYDIVSIYPNIGRYVILGWLAVMLVFQLPQVLVLVTFPFFLMELFNSHYFFCWVMKKGLKKVGYINTFNKISKPGKILLEMIENVPRRCA
jgi:hypothetical protein